MKKALLGVGLLAALASTGCSLCDIGIPSLCNISWPGCSKGIFMFVSDLAELAADLTTAGLI